MYLSRFRRHPLKTGAINWSELIKAALKDPLALGQLELWAHRRKGAHNNRKFVIRCLTCNEMVKVQYPPHYAGGDRDDELDQTDQGFQSLNVHSPIRASENKFTAVTDFPYEETLRS